MIPLEDGWINEDGMNIVIYDSKTGSGVILPFATLEDIRNGLDSLLYKRGSTAEFDEG